MKHFFIASRGTGEFSVVSYAHGPGKTSLFLETNVVLSTTTGYGGGETGQLRLRIVVEFESNAIIGPVSVLNAHTHSTAQKSR